MVLKQGISCSDRSFCFVAILIFVTAVTLRAQTPDENDGSSFSSSLPTLNSAAQDSSKSSNGSIRSNQDGNDWVHTWMRKVDEARASHILSRSTERKKFSSRQDWCWVASHWWSGFIWASAVVYRSPRPSSTGTIIAGFCRCACHSRVLPRNTRICNVLVLVREQLTKEHSYASTNTEPY